MLGRGEEAGILWADCRGTENLTGGEEENKKRSMDKDREGSSIHVCLLGSGGCCHHYLTNYHFLDSMSSRHPRSRNERTVLVRFTVVWTVVLFV